MAPTGKSAWSSWSKWRRKKLGKAETHGGSSLVYGMLCDVSEFKLSNGGDMIFGSSKFGCQTAARCCNKKPVATQSFSENTMP